MEPLVLIIGAGIAGLSAAQELTRAGVSCVLLEARDRIGGRIWTRRRGPGPQAVELGAEFVHGRAPEVLRLAGALGVALYEVPDRHESIQKGQKRALSRFWETIDPALKARPRGKAGRPGGNDESFASALARLRAPAASKRLASQFVQGFHAADPRELSQLALRRESEAAERIQGNRAFRILGGYGALVQGLAESARRLGCRLELRSPVRELHWDTGNVRVLSGTRERKQLWLAHAAIVTVPPGALGRISFVPQLIHKELALEQLASGEVVKVTFRFKQRFWAEKLGEELSFLHSDERYFPTWWSALPFQWPWLTGWVGGPAARELGGESATEVRALALRTLAKLTGFRAARLEGWLESADSHDWIADPYSLGAYSYVRPGGIRAPEQLARSVEGTLFFAGEATETAGLGGTVESAIASGRRAAREALQAVTRARKAAA